MTPGQNKTICSNCVNMLQNNSCKMNRKPVEGRCFWLIEKWSVKRLTKEEIDKLSKMRISEIERGYTCCNDCKKCQVRLTDCIIYSEKGKRLYKEWQKLHGIPGWM